MTARFARGLIAAALIVSPGMAAADPITVTATRLALDGDDPARTEVGALRFRGALDLTSPDPRFGGLSGLLVTPDGARFLAVSDKGYWVSATLRYDEAGNLIGVAKAELSSILDLSGNPPASKRLGDAEALARSGNDVVVAFENDHRLWFHHAGDGMPGRAVAEIVAPPSRTGKPRLRGNRGLEALVALPGGRFLALAEGLRQEPGDLPGWIIKGDRWRLLGYRRTGDFRPSGAAVLPSGDILVLERAFSWIGGLAGRLVRIDAKAVRPGAVLEGHAIAELRLPLLTDNYEAVDARPGPNGKGLIYLLSDDNYNLLQRTILAMFEYDDRGPAHGKEKR
jgi:hypothetical protein